ncbi:subtilisin family serine protease [Micromonospora pisi]|uniref:Subtilisin family serine protease n=1 Tax=Micromonospora pisi TaxID=589240 RepID=A0A495JT84_9ACTN|nr:S8 family serine peptidase [Micromonospora pisi]RKR92051.1 subtilisin family serine protease [Micromonospora pisi]
MLRPAVAIAAAIVLGFTAQPVVAVAAPASAPVDSQVLRESSGTGGTTFMVYLKERAKLDAAAKLRDADTRSAEVHRQLTGTADRTQSGLRALLNTKRARYTSYWIANALRVEGDRALVEAIAARPEVARIDPVRTYEVVRPAPGNTTAKAGAAGAEWGIANIEAPRVWDEFGDRGEGIVVANIDGGVQYDHPALVGKYRGNNGDGTFTNDYNWYDPSGVCTGETPCDTSGHGTHTMGTMVGDDGAGNQTGVAPGAKWIAAKACEGSWCSDASLLNAGQWMLAPTDRNGQNPRPDLRPDIVNNSWGGGQGNLWYKQVVDAWRAAGIFAVFSAGNSGPACNTANSPGDYPGSYAVGGFNATNQVYSYSSRGSSSADGGIKPNISAPGEDVRSTWPGSGYTTISGTSMAAPHVSGTVALIWSAAPSLRRDLAATEKLLGETATDVDATECGGTAANNNVFGEGRLNAYQAVLKAPRGDVGRISGRVTDAATGEPLSGVTITTGGPHGVTGTDGDYTLSLPPGEHTLTASAYGYTSRTVAVTVVVGGSLTENFALAAQPMVTVSGRVTDGSGHGWPLYARIDVSGRPGGPVFTDPVTGRYSFTVPANTAYTLGTTAQYSGYRKVTSTVPVADVAKTVNIKVPVDHGCTAAGYSGSFTAPLFATETFDGTRVPAGWSVVNRTESPGWAFDDPGNRGNSTGGSGNFAMVDSIRQGLDARQDTDLISPTFDLTGIGAPYLRFNSDLYATATDDMGDVDVSTDGGTTWTNVWHGDDYRRGPVQELVPLEPAAGQADVRVRFRYSANFGWWWGVDNVELINRACTPTPAGLVAGFVTDKNTGAGLNGVTVASPDASAERAVTTATPQDPNISDGFYWFLSTLTGPHPFEANLRPYQAVRSEFAIEPDRVNKANFALKAGRITVSQTTVEANQPYGSTRSTSITLKNTGSAPATVEALQRAGQFEVLAPKAAPLVERRVSGISKGIHAVPSAGTGGSAPGSPNAEPQATDPAWSRIANAPAQISDNSAVNLGGKVYSVGGGSGSGSERSTWVYDPDTNVWSGLPEMPRGRAKASAAAVNGKIYVLGGWSAEGSLIPSVDVFDPQQGTWSTLVGVLHPAPRAAAGTAVVDGKIIMVGGCADADCTDTRDLVTFDPSSRTFTTGADYPVAVSYASCGAIGSGVYCAGGISTQTYRDTYGYDLAADAWTRLPDLPIDLWGSQTTVAGEMLIVSGGVTANSSAVTNRTIAYDPASQAWRDLPNAQVAAFRGAMACGVYKIGGALGATVTSESERLSGFGDCSTAAAPWLQTTPASFTLAAGASKTITLTLTATPEAGIDQPGTYRAQIGFRADSPYPVPTVDVNVGVAAPADWGKIQGTVTGQSCAGQRLPLPATVRFNLAGTGGRTGYTLRADAQGRFVYWLPAGTYQVVVSREGWTPKVKQQRVDAGFTLTYDVVLATASSCGTRAGGI